MNYAKMLLTAAAVTMGIAATPALAQTKYVVPAGNATAEGLGSTQLPLGNGGVSTITSQFLLSASLLTGMPSGTNIGAIGFRINSNSPAQTMALSFTDYRISLGGSTRTVGGLSTNFTANQAADTTLVRSGALTIAANSFTATPSATGLVANPFYSIGFDTPFTYNGGDLLLTISFTGAGTRGLILDAIPYASGGVDSVSNVNPLGVYAQLYSVPVIQFTSAAAATAAVPEPATWAMMIGGFGLVGGTMRRRKTDARVRVA